jgi:hypothetical protein
MVLSRQQTHRVSKRSAPAKPKPKTKESSGDDRVMTDVLLAIKPAHLANIASQKKNHEYRKYRLRDGVERLWLYETANGNGRSAITSVLFLTSIVFVAVRRLKKHPKITRYGRQVGSR